MAATLSIIIPVKSAENNPSLNRLLDSIEWQDFPMENLEVIPVTEGTSESAKAIGIRQAKGKVIAIMADDNQLPYPDFLSSMFFYCELFGAVYPKNYSAIGNSLTRCCGYIGGNDPLCYYMGKNDHLSYLNDKKFVAKGRSVGDNGFFVLKSLIEKTDLDNYYHIDNANEIECDIKPIDGFITHHIDCNIIDFWKRRYRHGLSHAFNSNRRWHLVDTRKSTDILRLLWFIVATLTVIHPLITSIRGYLKIRDVAWFWHPVMCLGSLLTYSMLITRLGFQSLFALVAGRKR